MHISLNRLSKTYHNTSIFKDLTYELESGKRYGIAGYNGSGKSTLVKIIGGFVTPNSGTIEHITIDKKIAIENVYHYTSFAAPYLDLPTELRFYELLDFHFSMKRRKDSITNDGIRSIFELPLHLPIRQFSSGMLQRVKLALAFFTDSALLLLDEPTETLDENGFELYQLLLKKYSHGRTIIIASNKESDFINCESILRMTDYTE